MLKIVSRVVVAACALVSIHGAFALGSAGCGLGSVVFTENVWWKQVLAATTNGTSGSQTFGITSGTSNCAPGLFAILRQKQQDYVAANFTSLQREGAQVRGDTIKGLAAVLGCSQQSYNILGAATQQNYTQVFSGRKPAEFVTEEIRRVVLENKVLSENCVLANI